MTTSHQSLFDISSFDFILTPLSITSLSQSSLLHSHFTYVLELDKGPQLINTIQQQIIPIKDCQYYFQNHQNLRVKIHSNRASNFSFSLYHLKKGLKQYIDTLPLHFLDIFTKYIQQLNLHSSSYRSIISHISSNQSLGSSWEVLKRQFNHKRSTLITTNQHGSLSLQYDLQIKCQIDYYAEKEYTKTKLKSKTSQASKKSSSSHNSKRKQLETNQNHPVQPQLVFENINALLQEQQMNKNQPAESTSVFHPNQSSSMKQHQILSDIIEQSYEGESIFHRGQNSDRKPAQILDIKEEPLGNCQKIKTQTLLPNIQHPIKVLKKKSSLDDLHKSSKLNFAHDLPTLPSEGNQDYLQQTPKNNEPNSKKIQSIQSLNKKQPNYLIFISLLLIICLGLSIVSIVNKQQRYKQNRMKRSKLPKRAVFKFQFENFF